ncbi:S1C family serine protease [Fervidibacillus albus]|uniref:Trypsin-like peptidase domain-containing protein n=1 Tax=Fervidibacillus albus TaxID=2980026 RepID=A0A9E8LUF8_9BACI|nr:trypsin-like peptidase domain-containing protein [Fervidibacillus albus]WAA09560.1 trypsin-like peptidase domain-containing protein [Fervidibacillus albus]
MGYYDQDYVNEYRKKNRKRGYFFSGFIGALIGGLIVAASIPFLIHTDVLPIEPTEQNVSENGETEENIDQNGIVRNVSVNVTTDITKAVDKVSDTVVGITNYTNGNFWSQSLEAGTGSGVIYKKEGNTAFIVTNNHVIEGADQLEVSLSDGTKLEAELLGSDLWTDLAVIKVDGTEIDQVAEFGDSDSLNLGEPVIAIGNPLGLEFSGSITQGIISGLERTVPIDFDSDGIADWNAEVLQTDAAINPGNSGGALVNISGQVIGINSMKIAEQEVEGIGFSIPINIAIPIIEDLEQFGQVKRPYMGVSLEDISQISTYHWHETLKLPANVNAGLMIAEIVPGSPADQAGLKRMDVIVNLDGEEIHSIIDLRKYLYTQKEIGDSLVVGVYRDGEYMEMTIVLSEGQL